MASKQIYVVLLLVASVVLNGVLSSPCKKKEDYPPLLRWKPTIGILRIRYFLFGGDSLSQEELEISELSRQEPTTGRDKVPPSEHEEQMRPTDEKDLLLKRPVDQKEPIVPLTMPTNPQNQENFPVNPTLIDPSKTDPLPDESMNELEQQKIQDSVTNPNLTTFPAEQMNKPQAQLNEAKAILPQQLQQELQSQPLVNGRRKRSQLAQGVRKLLPDYDDSFPHFGPGSGDVHVYDGTHLYYDDLTGLRRPTSNHKDLRNDGVIDIERLKI